MKIVRTDIDNFKKRIKYRLKEQPQKSFAIQELIFGEGYIVMYNGNEFRAIGSNKAFTQLKIQDQLQTYLKHKSYQICLPF